MKPPALQILLLASLQLYFVAHETVIAEVIFAPTSRQGNYISSTFDSKIFHPIL